MFMFKKEGKTLTLPLTFSELELPEVFITNTYANQA